MKTMIVVTHLLGTGHLSRALTLARAFVAKGHDMLVASGGMPAPQLDHSDIQILQLPPLQSDGTNFTRLLDDTGLPADESYLSNRSEILNRAFAAFRPEILITELYPFGRRILSTEFLSLLDTAKALLTPPTVLSSIRDILAPPSKPSKATRADEIIARYYDAVLVHSDPQTTQLDQSWPVSGKLAPFLHYTGYVAPPNASTHPDNTGTGEILVSAGGGSVGDALFETAVQAARLDPNQQWRLLVGGSNAKDRVAKYSQLARGTRTIIEPARSDFRQMLHGAAASVSMCGYNTALDLLQAGTPAVMIPFDAGNEVEQTLRATSLASMPGLSVLSSVDLTPEMLNLHLQQVINDGPRVDGGLNFDGAAQTVRLACDMAEARI
ncbi:MAG: glycosyltransferase [Rhodobacteraceae bacterium]|nr:glycosyltransferase [Paracoccaceae bacterium]